MKPDPAPNSGEVVETTTRRRVVPASEVETKTPDLWDYLRNIPLGDWSKHMIYLYRAEPAPSVPLIKCADQFITFPDGQRVLVSDQEEFEFALTRQFGGGVFRVIVKKGPQWVTQARIPINAPVRAIAITPENNGHGNGTPHLSTMGNGDAQLAAHAIDTIANQDHQAVRIGIDALSAASSIVRNFGTGQPDPMMQQFMAAMMARLAQDPMEQMLRFITVMKELNALAVSLDRKSVV